MVVHVAATQRRRMARLQRAFRSWCKCDVVVYISATYVPIYKYIMRYTCTAHIHTRKFIVLYRCRSSYAKCIMMALALVLRPLII